MNVNQGMVKMKTNKVKKCFQHTWLGFRMIVYGIAFVILGFVPATIKPDVRVLQVDLEKQQRYKIRR